MDGPDHETHRPPSEPNAATGSVVGGVVGETEGLARRMTALASLPLGELSPDELVELTDNLQHLHSAVTAVRTAAVAACDTAGVHRRDGLRSCSRWLANRHRLPGGWAAGTLAMGRTLARLPRVRHALARGDISEAHARALTRLWAPNIAEVFDRDLHLLLEAARTQSFKGFEEVLGRWLAFADPDRSDGRDRRARKQRAIYLSRVGGRVAMDLDADTLSGGIIEAALDHFERRLFDEDWKATRAEHGEDACYDQMPRTPAQRRLDAMVLALETAYNHDTAGRGDPLVNVVVDHTTLDREIRRFCGVEPDPGEVFNPGGRCHLADGTPISPAQALHLAFRGHMARVVFSGEGRIIDMGRRSRIFTGALREALIIADRTCRHPGCDLPATRCEADHIIPWSQGGTTSLDNGQMLCLWHHRLKHCTSPTRAG